MRGEDPCDLTDLASVLYLSRSDLANLVRLQTLLDLHGCHMNLVEGAVVVIQQHEGQVPRLAIVQGLAWQWGGSGSDQSPTWRDALMIEVQGEDGPAPLASLSDSLRLSSFQDEEMGFMLADLHFHVSEGRVRVPSR